MRLEPPSPATASRRPRIGLVLGAGGITGIAWLAGVVAALREHTGWDPADADLVTGTSAGGVVAAVLAAGHEPTSLLRYAEQPDELAAAVAAATADRAADRFPLPVPGSIALALSGLVTTDSRRRRSALGGLLPRGVRSGDEIRGLTHAAASAGWPDRTELWLHACDMRTGRLVTFGRPGAPEAELADAVVATCAVPSYYRPVRIGGRHYVDGGLRSLSNADRLVGAGCDVVLVLSPFASRDRGPIIDTALYGAARGITAARTAREAEALRADGARVAILEPSAADIGAMGLNPMDRARSRRIVETAAVSAAERLDEVLDGIVLPSSAADAPTAAVAA